MSNLPFHYLNGAFYREKFLILVQFINIFLCGPIWEIFAISELPKFLSRSFGVLPFTFRSAVHLELIFLTLVKKKKNLFFVQMDIQLAQNNLLKRSSIHHCMYFCILFVITEGLYVWVLQDSFKSIKQWTCPFYRYAITSIILIIHPKEKRFYF